MSEVNSALSKTTLSCEGYPRYRCVPYDPVPNRFAKLVRSWPDTCKQKNILASNIQLRKSSYMESALSFTRVEKGTVSPWRRRMKMLSPQCLCCNVPPAPDGECWCSNDFTSFFTNKDEFVEPWYNHVVHRAKKIP